MGTASLLIGIFTALIAFIPFLNYASVVPALIGLAIGAIELVRAREEGRPQGTAIAGTVLNSVALVNVVIWSLVLSFGFSEIQKSFTIWEREKESLKSPFKKFFGDAPLQKEKDFSQNDNFFDKKPSELDRKKKGKKKKSPPSNGSPNSTKEFFERKVDPKNPNSYSWHYRREFRSDKPKSFSFGSGPNSNSKSFQDLRAEIQKHFGKNFPFGDNFTRKKPGDKSRGQKKIQRPLKKKFEKKYKDVI